MIEPRDKILRKLGCVALDSRSKSVKKEPFLTVFQSFQKVLIAILFSLVAKSTKVLLQTQFLAHIPFEIHYKFLTY